MKYIMVTGPMGAGKSTFMRSLPKPWGNFVVPNGVPDMLLDHACQLDNLMLYEIDAPTATGKVWICLLYTSPSPRDRTRYRMPSSA